MNDSKEETCQEPQKQLAMESLKAVGRSHSMRLHLTPCAQHMQWGCEDQLQQIFFISILAAKLQMEPAVGILGSLVMVNSARQAADLSAETRLHLRA
jgi:hypothetical protein